MRFVHCVPALLLLVGPVMARQSQPPSGSEEQQIAAALQAAPESLRQDGTVLGWRNGELTTLRQGGGSMVCVADNPTVDGYSASCYHKTLAPYIQRGRELRAEGKSFGEIRDIRRQEVEAGELAYPDQPVSNYILYGENGGFNGDTGLVEHVFLRYVVYTPYATVESTGLAEAPIVPGAPWLMDAGTYHAHIMITPPAPEGHH